MDYINLLPPELSSRRSVSSRKRLKLIALIVATALAAGGTAIWFHYLDNLEQRLSGHRVKRLQVEKQLIEVRRLDEVIKTKQHELEALQAIREGIPQWWRVLDSINRNIPQQVKVESLLLEEGTSLVLIGTAPSITVTGVLIHQLEQLSYFEVVVLNQVKQAEHNPNLVDFQVTAQFVQGSG